MSIAPIFISIIYDAAKQQKDDLLTIIPSNDGWRIKYDQNTMHRFVTRTFQYAELQPYLLKFFEFVLNDTPSFHPCSIQVDIPSFPAILVSIKDIKSKMPMICEAIFLTPKSWAEEKSVRVPSVSATPVTAVVAAAAASASAAAPVSVAAVAAATAAAHPYPYFV